MPTHHSSEHVALEPAELGEKEFSAIGRLVRACAIIEDACHIYLSCLVTVTPASLTILLGQVGISKKLSLAENFAKIRGPEEHETFKKLFQTERLSEVLKCRNATVHGYLLGRWPDGKWAFETTIIAPGDEPDRAAVTILSLKTVDLILYAEWAGEIARTSGCHPFVLEQRKERLDLPLGPSRKSQPKRKPAE